MIWLNALQSNISQGHSCVLVTVSDVQGSAPRAVGSRMLVDAESIADTIGGGALEQQAIDYSRSLLQAASTDAVIESQTIVLGKELTQCCGGRVTLNFEYHPAVAFKIVIFGAGHVAQSLSAILSQLPCRALFIDSREQWLEKLPCHATSYGVINKKLLGKNPFLAVEQCPDNAYFLVMTHSHELDFELVEAILSRGDSAYCGLIASKSKATRFRSRLARKGFTSAEIAKLNAPIGEGECPGKLPMEVAVATASEIVKMHHRLQMSSELLHVGGETMQIS